MPPKEGFALSWRDLLPRDLTRGIVVGQDLFMKVPGRNPYMPLPPRMFMQPFRMRVLSNSRATISTRLFRRPATVWKIFYTYTTGAPIPLLQVVQLGISPNPIQEENVPSGRPLPYVPIIEDIRDVNAVGGGAVQGFMRNGIFSNQNVVDMEVFLNYQVIGDLEWFAVHVSLSNNGGVTVEVAGELWVQEGGNIVPGEDWR